MQKLTDEVTQFQSKTEVEIKKQEKVVDTHKKLLNQHSHELESTQSQLSFIKIKQTNEACRVNNAIKEIAHLSQSQVKSSQQLEETQKCISQITSAEQQLTEQVSELTKQLSVTEEETNKQVSVLEKHISHMQLQQSQETTSKL